jgi:FixJ family two-component response regulator
LLQASGYTTTTFASAEEFLERAIVEQAIGLVLDIQTGPRHPFWRMSGIELRDVLLTRRVNRSLGFGFSGAYGLVTDDSRYQYVINGRVTFYF